MLVESVDVNDLVEIIYKGILKKSLPVISRVVDIGNGGTIFLAEPHIHKRVISLPEGAQFWLRFSNTHGYYVASAKYSHYQYQGAKKTLVFSLTSHPKPVGEKEHFSVESEIYATFISINSRLSVASKTREGVLLDLSVGGCRLTTKGDRLNLEDEVILTFELENLGSITLQSFVESLADVDKHCYGLKFYDISKTSRDKLLQYVSEKLSL